MTLNDTVARVTDRIVERSRDGRARFLVFVLDEAARKSSS